MKKVMLVFGTRPEAIKMCPLALELKTRKCFETLVCVTGQHKEMLQQVLEVFGVAPDYDLTVMTESQSLFDVTEKVLRGIRGILEQTRPDVVLVHGDTTTTFAAALACFYLNIPAGHVEAGLRTYDIQSPYPEEFNRQAVDIVTRFFVRAHRRHARQPSPGRQAGRRHFRDGQHGDRRPQNHGARGLYAPRAGLGRRQPLGDHDGPPAREPRRAHAEHVHGYPPRCGRIPGCEAHLRRPISIRPFARRLGKFSTVTTRIHLIDPLGPEDFHNFIARSYLVLTDSGGIQESAPALHKPVLVLRDTTERPEGVAAGTLKLTGTDEETIYREFKTLLVDQSAYDAMSRAVNPYGDGFASKRIADILEEKL